MRRLRNVLFVRQSAPGEAKAFACVGAGWTSGAVAVLRAVGFCCPDGVPS